MMADNLKDKERFVSRLDLKSTNLPAAWEKFKTEFSVYCMAKDLHSLPHERQVANMLLLIGPDCLPIVGQFHWGYGEKKTLDTMMEKFDNHFQPIRNLIYERSVFNQMTQGPEQAVGDFITAVQSQADNCEYGGMKNELVRDRIVVGVRDPKLRQYLIDIDNLDLERCIIKAKQYVSQRVQMQEIGASVKEEEDNLDAVSNQSRGSYRGTSARNRGRRARGGRNATNHGQCFYCGREPHTREQCPAIRAACHKCRLVGHWASSRACRGRAGQQRVVHNVADGYDADSAACADNMEGLYLGSQ